MTKIKYTRAVCVCGGGKNRIQTLESLRAFAFLGVFAHHTSLKIFEGAGAWGVSIFIMLSGFVLAINYLSKDKIPSTSCKYNLYFALNKIKKIYLLHVLTMIAMLPFWLKESASLEWRGTKIVLNLLLLQEWVPLKGKRINDVAWYLSVAVFIYFMFPWVVRKMKQKYSNEKALWSIMTLFLLQIIIGIIASRLPVIENNTYFVWDFEFVYWLCYTFPPIRFIDFLIGCNLGYLYFNKKEYKHSDSNNFKEIVCVLLSTVTNVVYIIASVNSSFADPDRWWTYSALFTVSSCFAIYYFAMGKGAISNALTNRVTAYFARISPYAYLIHYVVFRYMSAVFNKISGVGCSKVMVGMMKLTLGFALTVLTTEVWIKLTKICKGAVSAPN